MRFEIYPKSIIGKDLQSYKKSSNILSVQVDEKVILIPILQNIVDFEAPYYTLNKVGAYIWNHIDGEKQVKEIRDIIAEEFEEPQEEIEDDLIMFFQKLEEIGGVTFTSDKDNPKLDCKAIDFMTLSAEILGKGIYLRFRAKGGSMHPFIKNGEVIKVKPIRGTDVKIGDIIFYRTSCKYIVAHRLIKKHKENNKMIVVTKGDASLNFDPPVQEENIIGEVTAIEEPNGIINLDCKTWRIANHMIASYSLLTLSVYSKISFLKRVLIGTRKNRVIGFCSKVLITSFLFFQKSLLNFLLLVYNIRLKLKF